MLKKTLFLLLLSQQLLCFSQTDSDDTDDSTTTTAVKDTAILAPVVDDYPQNPVFRYEDVVYEKNIKSVQLVNDKFILSQPIMQLGGADSIKLSFDDLDGDFKYYLFTVIHCNANWKPSGLMTLDYIDGFENIEITDFAYSVNTLQQYTHYNAYLPSSSTHLLKSGNYVLKVFHKGDTSKVVLSKRFMVAENLVTVKAQINPASIVEYKNFKQEVDFVIDFDTYQITDPYDNLKVVIVQNNRWDNASRNLKPTFVKDSELVYNYDEDNVFWGSNEFRNFDIKTLQSKTVNVATIKRDSATNKVDVTLRPDEKRTFKKYVTTSDIDGNFILQTTDGGGEQDSETYADYCYVHFFIKAEEQTEGNVYVFGTFNGWQCKNENKMTYNPARLGYEATLYLKQGYYNYEYVVLPNGKRVADDTALEGMHSETENSYTIYVYNKQAGTYYDRLIAVGHFDSVKN